MPNNITILGRLTKDPEIRQTNSGKELSSFSIADNYGKDKVIFHEATVFDETLVNFSKNYLKKGYSVLVSGKLVDDSFVAKDGQKVKRSRVIVNGIDFAFDGKKEEGQSSSTNSEAAPVAATASDFGDEDGGDGIPF